MKTEELLTMEEIVEAWKISDSHARVFLKDLERYKIGRAVRFKKADVETHLSKFKVRVK
jgi:DNA-binding transcriptional regulator GbsR (MarR family)